MKPTLKPSESVRVAMTCLRPVPPRSRPYALLAVALLAAGCGGDDPVEPPTPPPSAVPTTVTITPDAADFESLGETVQLAATVLDQNGQAMAGASVTWTTSDAGVATVSSGGLVTATGNGMASVTATAGGATGSASVTVEQRAADVGVSPAADTLTSLGDTVRLMAAAADANGNAIASVEVTWSSGDEAVASVDSTGLVTATGNGNATITATAGAASGTATVTVAQEAFSPLELVPDATSLGDDARLLSPDSLVIHRLGATARLLPVGTDANGNALEPGAAVTWSSSDATVATVDSTGLVTAVAVGAAVVTATSGGSASAASDSDSQTRAVAAADGSFARTTAIMNVLVSNAPAALVALYEATDGPNWVNNAGWLTDAPLRDWYGVRTDGSGRVVTALWLDSNELTGSIPPELGNLSNLTSLGLNANNLTGSIPPELGRLTNLRAPYRPNSAGSRT